MTPIRILQVWAFSGWVISCYAQVLLATHAPLLTNHTDESLFHLSLNLSRFRKLLHRQRRADRKLRQLATPHRIDAKTIPKYRTELFIPPVLHDDQGKDGRFEISFRQFRQQMLPEGYPSTVVWGYGNPAVANSFHHPAATVEVTRNRKTYVTWRNELVLDPVTCKTKGFGSWNPACRFVKHVLQDKYGTPVIDTTLHWAAPDRRCASGKNQTDCNGPTKPHSYFGPIPMVPHLHGAHVEGRSDGYPESWFLPKASNIPKGYGTEGSLFRSRYLPSRNVPDDGNQYVANPSAGDKFFKAAADEARGKGYAVFRYTNDQETTALWFHDHALGLVRLNVYAGGPGMWLIRTATNGELRLAARDAKQRPQSLPGPPPRQGQFPNADPIARRQIREVPLVIQDKDFYSDGRLFYPANRVYFDYPDCHDGSTFGALSNGVAYKPNSDISPIWNPEAFFSTMVVNGNTFPKFTVAPERYRFRLLNACDSRTLNLALKIGSTTSKKELSMFVIGSDQGMLPHVVKVRTGYGTKITPGKPLTSETPFGSRFRALAMGPSERYDVIVDFAGLAQGTVVYMTNTGPDSPFGGFGGDDYEPADPKTSGQVMKFVVDYTLRKSTGDTSTSPSNLVLLSDPVVAAPPNAKVRDLSIFEYESKQVCVLEPPNDDLPCYVPKVNCNTGLIDLLTGVSSRTYGPIHAYLGYNGRLGPGKLTSQRWMDPIRQNPALGSTEIWELWNWTEDAHPIHVHQVAFRILGRYDMKGNKLGAPLPYEAGKKDTVIALPGQVTRIQLKFDIAGYFVWHCHILSHEDNEMMLPFCVGRPGVDCPSSLF